MEKMYLEILGIILENHLNVDAKQMVDCEDDSDKFFNILYNTIDERDIDTLINNIIRLKDFDFENYIMPYFDVILSKMQDKISFINICIKKLESKLFLFKYEKVIKNHLDLYNYSRFFSILSNDDKDFALKYEKEHKWLYEFRDVLSTIGDIDTYEFYFYYMMPLIKANACEYLNYVMPKVFDSKNLDISKLGRGTHNFAFAINDLVIRFGNFRRTFEIYTHYRINEFIIRKRFFDSGVPYYIDICPKANMDEILSDKDIEDALNDLNASNLVVTDKNYNQNFGIVEYEIPNKMFRHVEGIIGVRAKEPNFSFYNRPVKLIDQDYIYDINDPNKIWTRTKKKVNIKK